MSDGITTSKHVRRRLDRQALAAVLRPFVQTDRRRLLLGALLAWITAAAGMALLGLSGWFITASALAGLTTASALAFDVFTPSAVIRLLALGRTAGRYAERLVTHDATLAVLASLRERLFRGWATPQAAQALLRRPARLLFRLTQDVDALESIYLRVALPALTAFACAALTGLALGLLDLRLGLAVLGWLVGCGAGIAWWVARRARPMALRRALGLERMRAQVVDLVAGQTDLAMAGRLRPQCEAIARTDARLAATDTALNRLDTRAGVGHAIAGHLSVAGVLLAAGALAGQGALSAPLAAFALLLMLSALEPFAALRRGALEAGRSWLAIRRLAPRLRAADAQGTDGDGADHAHSADLHGGHGQTHEQAHGQDCGEVPAGADIVLELQSVSTGHPDSASGRPVLSEIDLHVSRGERIAVVGASGAGKSTLLAVAAGELPVWSGRARHRPCTWLTQRTELFQDSLRDNLRLAAPDASDAQLWAALRACGLADEAMRLADGLDTRLGEGGLGLSGGQSRRLALARLLLNQADCWLLDEPTEGLDAATAADVLGRLARHAAGHTVLIATHWRREAALADRIVVLAHGRLQSDLRRGSPGFDAALAALRQD